MNNLISNAIKFTQSGHVLVEVSNLPAELGPTQATLCVAVKDTGIGIAAENIGKVFERFTQAETSTTRNYGGTGLGLAICKQLVELMGGEIGIESVPGEGSTFWFTLPVELDSEPVSPLQMADLRGRTVLLVDDNRVNLSILEELMAYWGCNYVSFTDSEQVLAWLERSGIMVPDMAIVDHDMPGISGADLGQALRSHPLTAEMPMMVFSSRGRRGDTAFFEEMGFDGYLVKPSRPEEIRVMLAAMLGEPRQKGVKRGMKRGILTRHILGEREGGSGEVDAAASIGLKVMVVEDEPVNQKVVRLMLEELGCEVEVASSGAGGIAAYQEACKADTSEGTAFDIVLMDMQMPGMDGPTTTRVIRAFEADAGVVRTPIIALTANAMAEHRELCLAAGMDDYMTKPLTRSKLIEHLQRWSHHVMLPVVDESAMEGISGARVAELKEIFASSAQECLDDMVNAVAGDDRERFRQGAHRLKGAAATFGYVRLQQACSEAEGAVESANREQLVKRIRRELGNVAAV